MDNDDWWLSWNDIKHNMQMAKMRFFEGMRVAYYLRDQKHDNDISIKLDVFCTNDKIEESKQQWIQIGLTESIRQTVQITDGFRL